jgi:hypothetical protein
VKTLLPILILWFALPAMAQQRAPVIIVTNIAELVSLNPNQYARGVPARLTVRVLGYHTPNDGGGGDFDYVVSATATNLSGIFNSSVVAGGQWHRLNSAIQQNPESARRSFAPGFTTLHILGNSLAAGAASTDLSLSYGPLVATNLGLTPNLLANGSFNVSDVNWSSFDGWLKTNSIGSTTLEGAAPSTIDTNTIVLLDNWHNDVRGGATTTQWINGVRHLIHWWGIPHSAKRFAQDADSQTGTWTNNTFIGQGDIGLVGVSNGATLTFTNVVGSEIIISYLGWATSTAGTITVSIDGSSQTPINTASAAYGNREYVNGSDPVIPDYVGPYGNGKLDFCPQTVVYSGLGHSAHTVVITASNTGSGGAHVLWVAGNGFASAPRSGPIVICPSTPSQGVWTAGGTDLRQATFNKALETEIRAAQARGLRVVYAPLAEAINPFTDITDGVHWGNAGHAKAAEAFLSPFYLDLPYASAVRLPGGAESTSGGLGEFSGVSIDTTHTASTASDNALLIGYKINQSGSAISRGIQLYATENTLGSGGHRYINMSGPSGDRFYIQGTGRIVALPVTTSGGTAHSLGGGGNTASRILLYASDSDKDRALIINGDSIRTSLNSSGAAAELFLGTIGTTTQVRGGLVVGQSATVRTTLSGSAISAQKVSDGSATNLAIGSVGATTQVRDRMKIEEITMTAASGSDNALVVGYRIDQSGTAVARGLQLYATENTLGSGGHRYINASGPSGDRFYLGGDGRIVSTPTAASGGVAHSFGTGGASSSRVLIYGSDSDLDAELAIRGNSISAAKNSDGNSIGMRLGHPATTVTNLGGVQINGALNVGTNSVSMSNVRHGTATLVAGSATVSDAYVTSSTRIFLTSQSDGGTPGWLRVSARTASTSFTITSSSGTDTSTVAWMAVEP